jgi:hypothetical protein
VFRTLLTITVTVPLNSINRLGLVAETKCVSCEVRTEYLHTKKKLFGGAFVCSV